MDTGSAEEQAVGCSKVFPRWLVFVSKLALKLASQHTFKLGHRNGVGHTQISDSILAYIHHRAAPFRSNLVDLQKYPSSCPS